MRSGGVKAQEQEPYRQDGQNEDRRRREREDVRVARSGNECRQMMGGGAVERGVHARLRLKRLCADAGIRLRGN